MVKGRLIANAAGVVFLALAAAATPIDAEAQGLLKKIGKNAGAAIKKEVQKDLKSKGQDIFNGSGQTSTPATNGQPGRTVGDRQSDNVTSGTSYKRTTQTNENYSFNAVPDEDEYVRPNYAAGLHMGTFHSSYANLRHNYCASPTTTSKTVHLVLEDEDPYFSDFHDGLAYVYANGNAFYINKDGQKVGDSNAIESDETLMPRYDNGVVLERPGLRSPKQSVILRDYQGNIIKEFNTRYCSNMVDGIGIVIIPGNGLLQPSELRYIDTKGNFVFDNLKTSIQSTLIAESTLEALMRKSSEGLTAYATYDKKLDGWLWGFRDSSGHTVITPQFAAVKDFHDGVAAVLIIDSTSRSVKWGFIDKTGKQIIPPTFTKMPSDFDSGLAKVETVNGDAYIIDKTGKKIKGPVGRGGYEQEGGYIYISPFMNGYALAEIATDYDGDLKGDFYIVDTNFQPKSWVDSRAMSIELYSKTPPVTVSDGMLYIICSGGSGPHGVACLDPVTLDVKTIHMENPFIDGLSRVNKSGKGYVNKKNEFVIKFERNEF